MKNLKLLLTVLQFAALAIAISGCSENPTSVSLSCEMEPRTRVVEEKMPKLIVNIGVYENNPLNAGAYLLSDGTQLFDIVQLFSASINKEVINGNVRPTLYFDDKLAGLLEKGTPAKYVAPLQSKGLKVLLSVMGNWQGIGFANMNDTQTTQFAEILAYAVRRYELDGVSFDDEYANYGSTNSTSYSEIITKLRALMPSDKLICVNECGYAYTISDEALACIDLLYTLNPGTGTIKPSMLGIEKEHNAPMIVNLATSYTPAMLAKIRSNAALVAMNGYGGICTAGPRNDRGLPALNAIADGAYGKSVELVEEDISPMDWEFMASGFTISIDDVQ